MRIPTHTMTLEHEARTCDVIEPCTKTGHRNGIVLPANICGTIRVSKVRKYSCTRITNTHTTKHAHNNANRNPWAKQFASIKHHWEVHQPDTLVSKLEHNSHQLQRHTFINLPECQFKHAFATCGPHRKYSNTIMKSANATVPPSIWDVRLLGRRGHATIPAATYAIHCGSITSPHNPASPASN